MVPFQERNFSDAEEARDMHYSQEPWCKAGNPFPAHYACVVSAVLIAGSHRYTHFSYPAEGGNKNLRPFSTSVTAMYCSRHLSTAPGMSWWLLLCHSSNQHFPWRGNKAEWELWGVLTSLHQRALVFITHLQNFHFNSCILILERIRMKMQWQ